MAKQLQKWRAIIARSYGHRCSATVGPATLTESVMHNRLVAAGMLGCAYFGVEAFEPATSSSILAAILVWDLKSGKESHAHPHKALRTPLELFQENACHGGTAPLRVFLPVVAIKLLLMFVYIVMRLLAILVFLVFLVFLLFLLVFLLCNVLVFVVLLVYNISGRTSLAWFYVFAVFLRDVARKV